MQVFAGRGCCVRSCRVTGGHIYRSREIKSHKEWPVPVDEGQLRAFLWTAGYYREFVPTYAHIASPLHRSCKKGNGTVLDGQLNARNSSWTLSANCRMPPSVFPPGEGTVHPGQWCQWQSTRGGVVSDSEWEGTCNSKRCEFTIKGWEELQHPPEWTACPWVGNGELRDIPLWSTSSGQDWP